MHVHEKETLRQITEKLRDKFSSRVVSVYAFGSRVRGDYNEWSDFDVLVIVKDKSPEIEKEIVGIFVDEELRSGIPFSTVIKDIKDFELEKKFKTPFYENIIREGLLL